jgi:transcriptional regulator with XRE-family HTH domain
MTIKDFPARLDLALKALSISRADLAAMLCVDKSAVSRWLAGVNGPTQHNLAKLTSLLAARRPGFSMLDWELEAGRLAEKLGLSATGREAQTERAGGPLDGWLPPRLLDEAVATTRARGDAYEGFWRTTRPAIDPPGQFVHDRVLIRRNGNGLLSFRLGVIDMRFEGWACPSQTQLVASAVDGETGVFIFVILNAVLRDRADVLDGLTLTCQRGAGGSAVAGAVLLERTGFLGPDPDADDERWERSIETNPFVRPDSISRRIRDHLFRDVGPAALAAGGDALLTMAFGRSLSRGPDRNTPFPT